MTVVTTSFAEDLCIEGRIKSLRSIQISQPFDLERHQNNILGISEQQ